MKFVETISTIKISLTLNIFTVLKFTEHYLKKLNENCKMEQLPINFCFETLLFPSNPICSNFNSLLTVPVALHFQYFLHFDFMNMKSVRFSNK